MGLPISQDHYMFLRQRTFHFEHNDSICCEPGTFNIMCNNDGSSIIFFLHIQNEVANFFEVIGSNPVVGSS